MVGAKGKLAQYQFEERSAILKKYKWVAIREHLNTGIWSNLDFWTISQPAVPKINWTDQSGSKETNQKVDVQSRWW